MKGCNRLGFSGMAVERACHVMMWGLRGRLRGG